MCIDVFAAGTGKWYEFKCEENAVIKNIIKEMYIAIKDVEKKDGNNTSEFIQEGAVVLREAKIYRTEQREKELYENKLNLICIDCKEILDKNARLKDCAVENGNRLILI